MLTLWQDLRFGARMPLKKLGFTIVAIITLAFGIGSTQRFLPASISFWSQADQ